MPVRAVTPSPLSAFDALVDLERSRTFHAGGVPLGLETMEALLAALGPLPLPAVSVHVAGSEGKTSATERFAAGLSAAGLRTATYTSPHLRDPRERLRIAGRFPSDAALADAVDAVRGAMSASAREPSWFEALTLTARVLFAHEGVDAVVWETGLGGRLDATRAMHADVCAITSISLEHTAVLGPDLASIAREKAGILRPGVPLVLGADVPDEARAPIEARALELGCEVARVPSVGDVLERRLSLVTLGLDLLAARGLLPPRDARVDEAVRGQRVEGRDDRRGRLLFDGAHTEASLRDLVQRLAADPPAAIVFGATSGRDASAMARALAGLGRPLVLTRPPTRGIDPAEIALGLGQQIESPVCVEDDPDAALVRALDLAGPSGTVLITGSLYLVGRLLP